MAGYPIKNRLDGFHRNIILVFAGTFLTSFFNLLYQLLIAHRLNPADFAAFNSLLAIFMMVSAPLSMLQLGVAKYAAEFKARGEDENIRALLGGLTRRILFLAAASFFIFYSFSHYASVKLNISSVAAGYILAGIIFFAWILPLFMGGLQGLELFKWLVVGSVIGGGLKLALTFIFLELGFKVTGALVGFLLASLCGLIIAYIPLRRFVIPASVKGGVNFNEIFIYLIPVAVSNFCYLNLVSFDMVLVRYFFSPQDSGIYSLAQMLGKIFLFLPGAISIVMFPAVSRLNASCEDTAATFKRSVFYGAGLCLVAVTAYNLFPDFILRVLTGKAPLECIGLGRIFSVSMSFFALSFIFISYFLSLKDLRFIKYLVFFTLLQFAEIIFFHNSLFQVQAVMCANAVLLFVIFFMLVYSRKEEFSAGTVPH